jgi:hypothetical protein
MCLMRTTLTLNETGQASEAVDVLKSALGANLQ